MKNIRCVIMAILFMLLSFCMVSCGSQGYVNTEGEQGQSFTESTGLDETTEIGEQQEDTTIYRISEVVEKTDDGENFYTAEYDNEGRPVFYKVTQDNEHITTAELKYNNQGLLESVKIIYHDWDEFEMIQYSYDLDGNVIKEENSNESGFCSCYEYLYNKSNNTVEIYERKENGNLSLSMIEHYNYDKQLVTEEFYQEDSTFDFKRVYSYNSKGDVTSYQGIDHDGKQLFLWEYENTYNEKNELIKVKTVKYGESSINTCEYAYDDHGNLVSKTIIEGTVDDTTAANTAVRYEWTYADNGNVLSEALYRIQDNRYTYKREFSYTAYNDVQSQNGQVFDITQMFPNYAWN